MVPAGVGWLAASGGESPAGERVGVVVREDGRGVPGDLGGGGVVVDLRPESRGGADEQRGRAGGGQAGGHFPTFERLDRQPNPAACLCHDDSASGPLVGSVGGERDGRGAGVALRARRERHRKLARRSVYSAFGNGKRSAELGGSARPVCIVWVRELVWSWICTHSRSEWATSPAEQPLIARTNPLAFGACVFRPAICGGGGAMPSEGPRVPATSPRTRGPCGPGSPEPNDARAKRELPVDARPVAGNNGVSHSRETP